MADTSAYTTSYLARNTCTLVVKMTYGGYRVIILRVCMPSMHTHRGHVLHGTEYHAVQDVHEHPWKVMLKWTSIVEIHPSINTRATRCCSEGCTYHDLPTDGRQVTR